MSVPGRQGPRGGARQSTVPPGPVPSHVPAPCSLCRSRGRLCHPSDSQARPQAPIPRYQLTRGLRTPLTLCTGAPARPPGGHALWKGTAQLSGLWSPQLRGVGAFEHKQDPVASSPSPDAVRSPLGSCPGQCRGSVPGTWSSTWGVALTGREAKSCSRAILWATPSLGSSLSPLMTGRKAAEAALESSGDSRTPKTCREGQRAAGQSPRPRPAPRPPLPHGTWSIILRASSTSWSCASVSMV